MAASKIRPPDDTTTHLVKTGFLHPSACGERVRSPHPWCQSRLDPFLAAERFGGRDAVVILCNVCKAAWREVAA